MGDPLGSTRVSSQKQNREGVVGAQSGQYRVTVESSPGCGEFLLGAHWFRGPSKLRSEASSRDSNPMMGDPLGSSRVSSQKQNCEGVVEAQNRQYHATEESNPGCGGGPGQDVTH
ncbi:hypothetical protein DVH24_021396 [Malus domestica]|uniref:Uncharacterized protein n=1 Tax=Malus domestica TaxID=3750 RepID=A0A498K104_MALDO|nr:hypothetical protein DVH24_021396 [Malus domestica]